MTSRAVMTTTTTTSRPTIHLQPSITETTVVKTTTTTTTYAPIALPALPPPPKISEEDAKNYPLLNAPLPASLRSFELTFPGGEKAWFRDSSITTSSTFGNNDRDHFDPSEIDDPERHGDGWRQITGHGKHRTETVNLENAIERYAVVRNKRGGDDMVEESGEEQQQRRKRQRAEAPLSPLPSPRMSPERMLPSPENQEPFNPDLQLTTLLTLPSLLAHYQALPPQLQSHLLMTFLRHSPLPVLRQLHSVLTPTLSRDFLSLLPAELSYHICSYLSFSDLSRVSRVSKRWREIADRDGLVWRNLLEKAGMWFGCDSEKSFVDALVARRKRLELLPTYAVELAHPYKLLFKSRHLTRTRWTLPPPSMVQPELPPPRGPPRHISFPAHGSSVVTCLLISPNEGRIISASDDHTIRVFHLRTGELMQTLDGHEGGVWALAIYGDRLVSGSTDRTVRVWDLRKDPGSPTPSPGKCTQIFGGHTSTVRCLAIVRPEWVDVTHPDGSVKQEKWPKRSLIVTGSRDHSLRVWTLPRAGDPHWFPLQNNTSGDVVMGDGKVDEPDDTSLNPYHRRHLQGHEHAVRALAARGRTLVSGSYDCTVRVWDIIDGKCIWVLVGHVQKVYSVVLDPPRNQCMSGSMDGTVRIWNLSTGQSVHSLTGHQSLVGLLGLSPSWLVSAAADSTLRVWDPKTGLCRNVLVGHTGAITCFVHDEWKAVSGSDGTLKVWDVREGTQTRELLSGIQGVWQVAFEGRWCVAASSRITGGGPQQPHGFPPAGGQQVETVLDVWDFGYDLDWQRSEEGSTVDISLAETGGATSASSLPSTKSKKGKGKAKARMTSPAGSTVHSEDMLGYPPSLSGTSRPQPYEEEWIGEPCGGVYDEEVVEEEDEPISWTTPPEKQLDDEWHGSIDVDMDDGAYHEEGAPSTMMAGSVLGGQSDLDGDGNDSLEVEEVEVPMHQIYLGTSVAGSTSGGSSSLGKIEEEDRELLLGGASDNEEEGQRVEEEMIEEEEIIMRERGRGRKRGGAAASGSRSGPFDYTSMPSIAGPGPARALISGTSTSRSSSSSGSGTSSEQTAVRGPTPLNLAPSTLRNQFETPTRPTRRILYPPPPVVGASGSTSTNALLEDLVLGRGAEESPSQVHGPQARRGGRRTNRKWQLS